MESRSNSNLVFVVAFVFSGCTVGAPATTPVIQVNGSSANQGPVGSSVTPPVVSPPTTTTSGPPPTSGGGNPNWYPASLTPGFNLNLTGPNILPLNVGTCGNSSGYENLPCVSVTICVPGTANCQTIPNILLSTDDEGLRLFSSLVSIPLSPEIDPGTGNPLSECMTFFTQPLWGPIVRADVILGGENAVMVPIETLNAAYATPPADCANSAATPQQFGANGVLGVGVLKHDCGTACVTDASQDIYYACNGSACTATTAALNVQMTNPVSVLPVDNNGVSITLPGLANDADKKPANGFLILGIGTETNNTPASVVTLPTDGLGFTQVQVNGTAYRADFSIESFANFLPSAFNLPFCTGAAGWSQFLCPSAEVFLPAVFSGATGAGSTTGYLQIGNAQASFAISSKNLVTDDLAEVLGGKATLYLGVPFFFGKTISLGIEAAPSPLGTGPFVALPNFTSLNAAYIAKLYADLFNRTPSSSEVQGWLTSAQTTGISCAQLAGDFLGSAEFQSDAQAIDNSSYITRLYQGLLNRAPDSLGLQTDVNALTYGASKSSIAQAILNAPEFPLNCQNFGFNGAGIIPSLPSF